MNNWLIAENIIAIAALATAITVIIVASIKTSKMIKKVVHFFDDYFGEEERPGVSARPGFSERMSSIEKSLEIGTEKFDTIEYKLDKIDYELRPNSGMSLRDAVNRIEKRVQALESGDNNV
jgi:hypothetical protein